MVLYIGICSYTCIYHTNCPFNIKIIGLVNFGPPNICDAIVTIINFNGTTMRGHTVISGQDYVLIDFYLCTKIPMSECVERARGRRRRPFGSEVDLFVMSWKKRRKTSDNRQLQAHRWRNSGVCNTTEHKH